MFIYEFIKSGKYASYNRNYVGIHGISPVSSYHFIGVFQGNIYEIKNSLLKSTSIV